MRSVNIPRSALTANVRPLSESTRSVLIEHGLLAEAGAFAANSAIVEFSIPRGISSKFPKRGAADPTAAHVTLLIIGSVTSEQFKTVQRIAQEVAADTRPFTVRMSDYAEFNFTNPAGVKVSIPHMRIESPQLWWLHKTLWERIEEAGIKVQHRYGPNNPGRPSKSHFEAHATLGILTDAEPYSYDGPKPTGSWAVDEFGVGLGTKKRTKVKLGSPAPVMALPEGTLVEAMKQPKDLPPHIGLALIKDASYSVTHHSISTEYAVAFWNMDAGRQAREYEDGLFGAVGFDEASGYCDGAFIVSTAGVEQDGARVGGYGWGPMLYDAAMELATKLGKGITSDRSSVSDEAHEVWQYYFRRKGGIRVVKLDDVDNPRTPDPDDDCEMGSARSHQRKGHSGTIYGVGEAYRYEKPLAGGIIQQFAKMGKLVARGMSWPGASKGEARDVPTDTDTTARSGGATPMSDYDILERVEAWLRSIPDNVKIPTDKHDLLQQMDSDANHATGVVASAASYAREALETLTSPSWALWDDIMASTWGEAESRFNKSKKALRAAVERDFADLYKRYQSGQEDMPNAHYYAGHAWNKMKRRDMPQWSQESLYGPVFARSPVEVYMQWADEWIKKNWKMTKKERERIKYDLELYIENTYDLYREQKRIEKILRDEHAAGKYKPRRARDLFRKFVAKGVRHYTLNSSVSMSRFPKKIQHDVADLFLADFRTRPADDNGLGMKESLDEMAAKRPNELPEEIGIALVGPNATHKMVTQHSIPGDYIVTFWNVVKNRQARTRDDDIFGAVSMKDAESYSEWPCSGALIVASTGATGKGGGWGPMIYDAAMEYATKITNGGRSKGGLAPDRESVSDEAHNVWSYYANSRHDVKDYQLDINSDDAEWEGSPQVTPGDTSDDCAQGSAIEHDGFPDSPLARRYVKDWKNGVLAKMRDEKKLVVIGGAKFPGAIDSKELEKAAAKAREKRRQELKRNLRDIVSMVQVDSTNIHPWEVPMPLTQLELKRSIYQHGSMTLRLEYDTFVDSRRGGEITEADWHKMKDEMLDASEAEGKHRIEVMTPDIRKILFTMWDKLSTEYLFFVEKEFVKPALEALGKIQAWAEFGVATTEEVWELAFKQTQNQTVRLWFHEWRRGKHKKRGMSRHPADKKVDKILKILGTRHVVRENLDEAMGAGKAIRVLSRKLLDVKDDITLLPEGPLRRDLMTQMKVATNYLKRLRQKVKRGLVAEFVRVLQRMIPLMVKARIDHKPLLDPGKALGSMVGLGESFAPEHNAQDMPVRGFVTMRRPEWLDEVALLDERARADYFGSDKPLTRRWDAERIKALIYHGIRGRAAEDTPAPLLLRRIRKARQQIKSMGARHLSPDESKQLLATLADAERDIKAGRNPRTGDEPEKVGASDGGFWSWLFGEAIEDEDPRPDYADVKAVLAQASHDDVWDGLPFDDIEDRVKLPADRVWRALKKLIDKGKVKREKGPDGVMRFRLRPGAAKDASGDGTLADARIVTVPRAALS